MSTTVIAAENLTRRFGEFVAVDHISFSVQAGEIVGYLGPNGSGKTTTIRLLLGLLKPSEGHAWVLGFDAFRQSEEVRRRSGYMSQRFALYEDLTVAENLQFYSGLYGLRERRRQEDILALVGLQESARVLARDLAAGYRQRLALAIALVHRPQLLFLDEPTSGVDPIARRAFWERIYELAAEGVTVLVTTHYMDEAEYCGRVGILRDGRLLAMDTPTALKTSVIPGVVWEVYVRPLDAGLQSLQEAEGVLHVGLGDAHLRVIAHPDCDAECLRQRLQSRGLQPERIERGEPTLEEVFLTLAR
jgi:ABC-2 type transport system ATP-binding protein